MLVNRIGDFCLLIAIFTIFYFFNSLDYDIIFSLASYTKYYILQFGFYQINCIDFICLLLFGGAMGKSAQIGLHT
jgi:NADH-quinone oxidoreductase subunit L